MHTNHHTIRLLVVLVALATVTGALAPGLALAQSDGPPEPPHRVYGDVTDGGSAVQGVTVEVTHQGSVVATDVTDGAGYYDLAVEADAVQGGGTMTVSVDGVSETLAWEAGGADELDFAVDGTDDESDGGESDGGESDDTPEDGTGDDDSSGGNEGGEDEGDETGDDGSDDDASGGADGDDGGDSGDGIAGGSGDGASGGDASGEDTATAGDAPDDAEDGSSTPSSTEIGDATATAATPDDGTDAESTATATGTETATGPSGDGPTALGGLDPLTLGVAALAVLAIGGLGYVRYARS